MQNISYGNRYIYHSEDSNKIISAIESNKQNLLKGLGNKILYIDLGILSYMNAYIVQTYLFNTIKENNGIGIILLLEHNPVITIGNNGITKNLLVGKEELNRQDIELINSNRGGDITFHGPGQLVGYPIFNLSYFKKDIQLYVYNIEQVIINLLDIYGIKGIRVPEHRGVFVGSNKIASIGIRIKRWITTHGFSLNVNVNLGYFNNLRS
jgi:lipoyl(octanoyl) transferase